MSELCKIESPISLHLMSLNFEKTEKKRGWRTEGNEMTSKKGWVKEDENESTAQFWLMRWKSGCKCERLQPVCVACTDVGVQMGFIAPLMMPADTRVLGTHPVWCRKTKYQRMHVCVCVFGCKGPY